MTEVTTRDTTSWTAVLSVAAGTFAMVTTEFLPIGLLSRIADEFQIAPGRAGLLVTIPGVVAAISAPLVTLMAGRSDRRLLLVLFSALILVSNIIVAFSPNFATAVAGRALLGISVGGFWTFAASIGRRLVGEQQGNRATSIILAGISIGTVVGVPIGTVIGNALGWRAAFGIAAALCLSILVSQAIVLPRIIVSSVQSFASLAGILKNRTLVFGFLLSALASCGHFTAYTYLEPHLVEDVHVSALSLGWLLAIYGVAGVLGTFVGEAISSRNVVVGFAATTLVMALAITLSASSGGLWLGGVSIALWGLSFGAVPVCVQIWTYKADPEHFETSSALMVAVFQIALAVGSFAGGSIVDAYGLQSAFILGAVLSLACAVLLAGYRAVGTKFRTA